MTHYIIDRKKRLKYLYLFLFFITTSFGIGYTLGYLYGVPEKEVENINHKVSSSLAIKPHSTPQMINSKENTEITPPTKKSPQQNNSSSESIKPDQVITSVPPQAPSEKAPPPTKISSLPEPTIKIDVLTKSDHTSEKTTLPSTGTLTESTNKNSNQYTVQVGLFASKENASDFVDELKESGFETFYKAFISTSGEEKYNVRLGPFPNKNSAQEKMDEFQKLHDISAYILSHK